MQDLTTGWEADPATESNAEVVPKPSISLFFPVYNDEATIERITTKAITTLEEIADRYEIVIVDDGSPDRSGIIAEELAEKYPQVTVVHHAVNKGYGAALQTGFRAASRYEWICQTDGDDQYDLRELHHLVTLLPYYDAVVTFRRKKIYGYRRILISGVYNWLVRGMFGAPFRDISCGMRLIRRRVLDNVCVTSDSPFAGAEVMLRAMCKGYRIGEVGISTYPREQGRSSIISVRNIVHTMRDMLRVRSEVFQNQPR
ncbi:MAG: glycosyltransferase family 2 protein [Planctomycetota bacterium]